MVDADRLSDRASLVLAGHGEGSPVAVFVLVVGHEIDLIVAFVRIDLVEFLTVVVLAVDEGNEQASGLRTEHVFEYARFKIVLELVAGRVLSVFQ